ncbi:MAG: ankyrin repeat domain-containing protein [Bdellovibrionales bacterium]
MKTISLSTLILTFSISANAEVVFCHGFTAADQKTKVELTVQPQKKKGQIRFISNSSSVTHGLNLNDVYYPTPNTLRYADYFGNSHLDFYVENGIVKKNSFSHGIYFKNAQLDCKIAGQIPQAPKCENDPSESLISVLREGRFHRTLRAVNYVIACGADVNFTDKLGCTPLLYAVDSQCGKNTNSISQSISDLPRVVDRLISEGAFVDIVDPAKNETALLKAAKSNLKGVYESFIAAEANFDFQDNDGMTPLMWAAYNGDDWTVKDILEARPDRRLKNKNGQTAFDIATHWQKVRVIDLVRVPDVTFEIFGMEDGKCSPLKFEANKEQTIEIALKAPSKMFKLDSIQLGIDLMADSNSRASQVLKIDNTGSYNFTCGVHHADQISIGEIVVK